MRQLAAFIAAGFLAAIVGCTGEENSHGIQATADTGSAEDRVRSTGSANGAGKPASATPAMPAIGSAAAPAPESGPVTAVDQPAPRAVPRGVSAATVAPAPTETRDPAPAPAPANPPSPPAQPAKSAATGIVLGGALAVTPIHVDFGPVGHDQKDEFTITILNRSDGPLEITDVKPNCGCMEAKFAAGVLEPGASRQGTVKIGFGRSFGSFHKKVAIHVAGKPAPAEIGVTAQFHPNLQRPDKNSVELAGILGRTIPESTGELVLRRKTPGTTPIRVENLRVEGIKGSLGHLAVELQPVDANSVKLIVRLLPSHPVGQVTGKALATVEGLGFQLPISGNVYQGIRTKPDYFQFDQFFENVPVTRRVELIPCDERDFKIVDIGVEPPVVSVEVLPRDGGGYVLVARPIAPFPARANMPIKGSVNIETDHPQKAVFGLRVMGVFRGKK
ncbi:MAG: DUF1573 domain-containing protein [Planctomycetes bacterium]|nr:DUF1573 domain-containing protein [Planctomycetota bacterium]